MKKFIALSLLALGPVATSRADLLFADSFDQYTAGNLVGQGNWQQTGAATATPVQATGTAVQVNSSGQDVFVPLGTPHTLADNSSFYIGLTINVSAAQTAGDYFLHTTPTVGNSSIFPDRVFVKSTTGGYLLGYEATSGGGATVTYGTTVLTLGTSYRMVLAYNDVPGALNDTASLYVNPTDTSVEANNTAYLGNVPWISTSSAESDVVAALNLRQGTAASAPTLTVDDLDAGTTFADIAAVAQVPEPSTLALLGVGVAAVSGLRRRK